MLWEGAMPAIAVGGICRRPPCGRLIAGRALLNVRCKSTMQSQDFISLDCYLVQ